MSMYRLFASIHKEFIILRRDWTSMGMVYLMPMVLVLIVSLVQEGAFRALKDARVEILLLNEDTGEIGRTIEKGMRSSPQFTLRTSLGKRPLTFQTLKQHVARGDVQVGLYIPPNTSQRATKRATQIALAVLSQNRKRRDPDAKTIPFPKDKALHIGIFFDPTIRVSFRHSVRSAVRNFSEKIEIQKVLTAILDGYTKALPGELRACMKQIMAPNVAMGSTPQTPKLGFPWGKISMFGLKEHTARQDNKTKVPTSVQQNVPAWTLFAMFFIVIPLSNNIIKERVEGTFTRLRTMAVSSTLLFAGKIIVYMLVCLSQLALMLLMGKTILPMLGTPVLEMGNQPLAILLVAICAALAAVGFGILLGVAAKTHDQAAMIGAISIVISAAIGGLMVPTFIMPPVLQTLSQISPLGWGLDAFLSLFVRGGSLATVWPHMLLLLGFFASTVLISLGLYRYKKS